ncbi:hypothetical protein QTI17_32680 [Variovorax sp. J31P179]|uniref:hypothetical protein n=1 Tax=Variovorax sp. J31P179 TaxID=3053508 RepID=UPI002577E90F|nr:hypothetical protein [Variovorax sp. J31P179]MDM0085356.1 hypothetical protein [Variovorax sp. J31P179]
MRLQGPEPLGHGSRAHHVDEEEEASLGEGLSILACQQRHEGAVADQARGLKHHHHDGNRHEREKSRDQTGAGVVGGDDAQQSLARLASDHRPGDRAVDKRLQDEHRDERQRVEPAHRGARQQEHLDAADRRSREHGTDDADRHGDQQGSEQRASVRGGHRARVDGTDARADGRGHAHDAHEAPQSFAPDGWKRGGHPASSLRAARARLVRDLHGGSVQNIV